MEQWMKISLLLSVFGFLREIRPSEPFITDFLTDFKNFELNAVLRNIYPIGTYSLMVNTIIAFFITDYLRYKPLIFVSGLSGVIVWALLLWTEALSSMIVAQLFYGTYIATEVAYYTYIYAKVDRDHYDRVTAHTRSSMFWGRFLASVVAQTLLYVKLMDYESLNYITFGSQVACTLWVFLLPKVESSIYFHRKKEDDFKELESIMPLNNAAPRPQEKPLTAFQLLWSQFKTSYSNVEVLQWSIWYTIGTCGFYQVTSYCQVLWSSIEKPPEMVWNGAVEALVTLLSALVTTFAEKIHGTVLFKSSSLVTLTILTTFSGFAILLGTKTTSLYISYAGYIIFCTLFAFTITISSAEVAKRLAPDSFGLIFGFNTAMGLTLQSLLTFVVVSKTFMDLDVKTQFTIYAGFFFFFAFLYFLNIVINFIVSKRKE
ncbi:folate transporter 1-like [Culicoides brevitarsis]|uniref:folate transporter 1-like n=1 Tax=Culicoides brevitarsis TaxID=469753 RepID=UPI00307B51F0